MEMMTMQELQAKIERYEAALREGAVGHLKEPDLARALALIRAALRKALVDEMKRLR